MCVYYNCNIFIMNKGQAMYVCASTYSHILFSTAHIYICDTIFFVLFSTESRTHQQESTMTGGYRAKQIILFIVMCICLHAKSTFLNFVLKYSDNYGIFIIKAHPSPKM